jgi:hypothetical protein
MSELEKSRKWLRQANAEYDDPLKVFGTLIAEFMDAEPRFGLWIIPAVKISAT